MTKQEIIQRLRENQERRLQKHAEQIQWGEHVPEMFEELDEEEHTLQQALREHERRDR